MSPPSTTASRGYRRSSPVTPATLSGYPRSVSAWLNGGHTGSVWTPFSPPRPLVCVSYYHIHQTDWHHHPALLWLSQYVWILFDFESHWTAFGRRPYSTGQRCNSKVGDSCCLHHQGYRSPPSRLVHFRATWVMWFNRGTNLEMPDWICSFCSIHSWHSKAVLVPATK